ncbi:hypothetical protein L915_07631, partial [Phytophthora nicotianae]
SAASLPEVLPEDDVEVTAAAGFFVFFVLGVVAELPAPAVLPSASEAVSVSFVNSPSILPYFDIRLLVDGRAAVPGIGVVVANSPDVSSAAGVAPEGGEAGAGVSSSLPNQSKKPRSSCFLIFSSCESGIFAGATVPSWSFDVSSVF